MLPAVARTWRVDDLDLDLAGKSLEFPQDLVLRGQRGALVLLACHGHEVAQSNRATRGVEDGLEHVRIRQIASLAAERAYGAHPESSPALGIEERREDRRAVEPWPAQPVECAVSGNERRAAAVADEGVVAYWGIRVRALHDG